MTLNELTKMYKYNLNLSVSDAIEWATAKYMTAIW